MIRDQYGNVLCGVGYCAADDTGRLLCSTIPSGNVARDSYGKVTCGGDARMHKRSCARTCGDLGGAAAAA